MVPMPLSNKRLGTTEAVQELDNPTAFYTRNSGGHLNRDLHSNLKSFINFRKEKYMTYCLVVSHPQNAGNFIYSKRLTIHVFLLGVFPTAPAPPPPPCPPPFHVRKCKKWQIQGCTSFQLFPSETSFRTPQKRGQNFPFGHPIRIFSLVNNSKIELLQTLQVHGTTIVASYIFVKATLLKSIQHIVSRTEEAKGAKLRGM